MQTEMVTMSTSIPARVLVVGEGDGLSGAAMEAEAAGHEVLRAPDLHRALGVVSEEQPDVVIVEAPDGAVDEVLQFCDTMRNYTRTIVFLLYRPPVTESMRKKALRAGVWHVTETPVDPEELLLRIDLAVSVRRDTERVTTYSLVDAETGLYNSAGLARRTRELSAEAMRTRTTLACIVISAVIEGVSATRLAAARSAEVLRTLGRLSDIVGRVGPTEYIVLAPATTSEGAAQLARRLAVAYRVALVHALPKAAEVRTQAGYSAMANLAYAPLESADILARASAALRGGPGAPYFKWLHTADLETRTLPS